MFNQLIKSIIFLTAVTLPFWLAARIIVNILRKKWKGQFSVKRELILTAFFIYLIFVTAMTIMPLPMTSFRNPDAIGINLIPVLNLIKCFLPNQTGSPEMLMFYLENIIGNIVLFIPFGALLPLISDKYRLFKKVILIAVLFSLSIEVIQFLFRLMGSSFRSVDIDDILLNALGACLGFGVFKFLVNKQHNEGEKLWAF